MDLLPDETVLEIAELLRNDPHAYVGQQGLARLARLSRRYHRLATPLLYLEPVLSNLRQAEKWGETYGRWTTPFRLCELQQGKRSLHNPEKLTFDYSLPAKKRDRWGKWPHWLRLEPVPVSEPCLSAAVCSSLSSLKFINCDAEPLFPALLGPGQTLRRTLKELIIRHEATRHNILQAYMGTKFCLEYFEFTDTDHFASRWVPGIGGDPDYDSDREDSWLLHAPVEPPYDYDFPPLGPEAIKRAHFDYLYFEDIFEADVDRQPYEDGLKVMRTRPPSAYPFFALQSLELYLHEDETAFFLVFSTASFPSLKRFKPTGAFRLVDDQQIREWRATLRYSITRFSPTSSTPHGVIHAPECAGVDEDVFPSTTQYRLLDPEWWLPLSPQEWEKYPYVPYRGPELDILDLRDLDVQLVGRTW